MLHILATDCVGSGYCFLVSFVVLLNTVDPADRHSPDLGALLSPISFYIHFLFGTNIAHRFNHPEPEAHLLLISKNLSSRPNHLPLPTAAISR